MTRTNDCRFCRFSKLLSTVTGKADSYDAQSLGSLSGPYRKMAAQLEMMIEAAKSCSCDEAKN